MSVSFKVSEFGRSQKWVEIFEFNSNWTCPIISILKLFESSRSSISTLFSKLKISNEIYTVLNNQFRFTLLDPVKSPVIMTSDQFEQTFLGWFLDLSLKTWRCEEFIETDSFLQKSVRLSQIRIANFQSHDLIHHKSLKLIEALALPVKYQG